MSLEVNSSDIFSCILFCRRNLHLYIRKGEGTAGMDETVLVVCLTAVINVLWYPDISAFQQTVAPAAFSASAS